jgi:predicted Zn-dependent peptidase
MLAYLARRWLSGLLLESPQLPVLTTDHGLAIRRIPMVQRSFCCLVAFQGSRGEREHEQGFTHFLEHMAFRGSEMFLGRHEVNNRYRWLGARRIAETSEELLLFHATASGAVAPDLLDLLTDHVARPTLAPEEIDLERKVVALEIARAQQNPADVAGRLLDKVIFGHYPLGRSTLGTETSIQALTREALLSFRDRQWSPRRGVAILAGNLSHIPKSRQLVRLFNRFQASGTPDSFAPIATTSPHGVVVERRDGVRQQSHLRLAYAASINPSDLRARIALEILANILGGSGGQIRKALRGDLGASYASSAYDRIYTDAAFIRVGADTSPAQCVAVYRRILEILETLRERGPSQDEFIAARNLLTAGVERTLDTPLGIASNVAWSRVVRSEELAPHRLITTIAQTSYTDVLEIAASLQAPWVVCVGPHDPGDFAG